jgi:hypothetical protein
MRIAPDSDGMAAGPLGQRGIVLIICLDFTAKLGSVVIEGGEERR